MLMPVCVLWTFSSSAPAFLIDMNVSFKSLFAIWSSSPQRFHYYFYHCVVSWQYQKYSIILILVLCLLFVTQLVCSLFASTSNFAPSSPFFSIWWKKDCELFIRALVFQGSPSTSLHPPQMTYVFADCGIGLLCHALCICVAHVPSLFSACTLSLWNLL